MFKNVIVGVDEHEGTSDAIVLAQTLMEPQAGLTLGHIYPGDPHVWRGSSAAYDAAERDRAIELVQKARDAAGIRAELRWRGAPSIGRGLHELAELTGADLLVLGSPRGGLLGRVQVGESIHAALNGAPCAVAFAPAGYSRQPVAIREIGVGYDRSPESEHAVRTARELAARLEVKLSAFTAVNFPTWLAGGRTALDGTNIEDALSDARARIAALGDVEPHVAYGRPAEELALYSASLDLLIVGSRSYGPIGRLVHGSVSEQLARSVRCPLLVLTRGEREREADDIAEAGQETTPTPVTS